MGADDLARARHSNANNSAITLSSDELKQVLNTRMQGGMGISFAKLSNMLLATKGLAEGRAISLATNSQEISNTMLRSNFPSFYKPTLEQFLDAVALQTKSKWAYDPQAKSLGGEKKDKRTGKDLIVFEFVADKRKKPYELNLAKDWSTKDNGNWVNCTPPGETTGMDIYELGNFTSINKANEAELLKQVPQEVSLEWARRVKPRVKKDEFKEKKLGNKYDAVFFESMVKTQNGKSVHWRQWVFMAGNACYFIVSTVYPEKDASLFADIESMLKSFKIRDQT